MPLVPAICTQCKAALTIDPSQEAAICPFCNTPFITEKAINTYNTTNITNIGNLHANVVSIQGEKSLDDQIMTGETFLKFKEYRSAKETFWTLANQYPYDYRIWWNLVKCYSKDFTEVNLIIKQLHYIERLYNKACMVSSEEQQGMMTKAYAPYHELVKSSIDARLSYTIEKIQLYTAEYTKKEEILTKEVSALSKKRSAVKILKAIFIPLVFVLAFIISLCNAIAVGGLLALETFCYWFFPSVTIGILLTLLFLLLTEKTRRTTTKKILTLQNQLSTLRQEHISTISSFNSDIQKLQNVNDLTNDYDEDFFDEDDLFDEDEDFFQL